jgi:aryl-alcohol dehydrogenase-like predicted oxidoreductase
MPDANTIMLWPPSTSGHPRHSCFLARRRALKLLAAGTLIAMSQHDPAAQPGPATMARRPIPRSGELLPVIGLGTYAVFDVAPNTPEIAELREVLKTFAAGGASVVDSSPMYGRAERVVGELAGELALRPSLFLATKVWTSGRQAGIKQMQDSMRLLRTQRIDLMQVHNLLDVATHFNTLRDWKQAGTLRYLGITHYYSGAYRELETLLATRAYDFVQFNYSLAEREAEARLLSAAAETGAAVIINRPFAQGELFAKVKDKALPAWAAEFDCKSWAQFFLKYILAHPAVTCVIPGSGKVRHMTDNLQAGAGRLPDAGQRKRMVALIQSL